MLKKESCQSFWEKILLRYGSSKTRILLWKNHPSDLLFAHGAKNLQNMALCLLFFLYHCGPGVLRDASVSKSPYFIALSFLITKF